MWYKLYLTAPAAHREFRSLPAMHTYFFLPVDRR